MKYNWWYINVITCEILCHPYYSYKRCQTHYVQWLFRLHLILSEVACTFATSFMSQMTWELFAKLTEVSVSFPCIWIPWFCREHLGGIKIRFRIFPTKDVVMPYNQSFLLSTILKYSSNCFACNFFFNHLIYTLTF